MANFKLTQLPDALTALSLTDIPGNAVIYVVIGGVSYRTAKDEFLASLDLQVITDSGAETTNPMMVKESDDSRALIVSPAQITVLADNGNQVAAMQFEEPTGISGTGSYFIRDVGDTMQTVAFMSDIPTVNDRYKGTYTTLGALETAHPTASAGDYAIVDGGIGVDAVQYIWDDDDNNWIAGSSTGPTTTDALTEGSSNLYFTGSRVLSTILSGISFVTGTAITAADTILEALGKLQKQITDLSTGKQDKLTETNYSDVSTIVGFSAYDTKLIMIQDFQDLMIINYQISGTSNATNFTFTIPNSVPLQQFRSAYVRNNSSFVTGPALIQASGTTVTIFNGTTTFTASGTKSAYGTIILFKD